MNTILEGIINLVKKAQKILSKKEAKYIWVGFGKNPL